MPSHKTLLMIFVLSGVAAFAQETATTPLDTLAQKMQKSIARQQAGVSRMAVSIDRQKESVRRHARQETDAASEDFFNLAPPPRTLASVDIPVCDALPPADVNELVETAARREDVDPGLIRTVMQTESAYRPCALSAKGAMGLMQLMPETAGDLAVNDPFDPEENVAAGAKLLKELLRHYDGDLPLALSAYNAGPAKVDQTMSVPAIPETMNYVQKILATYPMESMPAFAPRLAPDRYEAFSVTGLGLDEDPPVKP